MLRLAAAIVPEVRQLLAEDPSQLGELLEEIHDEDLADLLGMLDDHEAALVLSNLKAEDAAPIFERLDEDTQESIVEKMGFESIAPIIGEMSADERTDLIENLPEAVGEGLLESLEKVDPEAAAEVEELAKWAEDSAGGLMTTDYVSCTIDLKVREVIELIRKVGDDAETVYSVYVVGEKNRLLGVVSLRDLLLSETGDPLEVMTKDVFTVGPGRPRRGREDDGEVRPGAPSLRAGARLLGVHRVERCRYSTRAEPRTSSASPRSTSSAKSYFNTSFWMFIQLQAGNSPRSSSASSSPAPRPASLRWLTFSSSLKLQLTTLLISTGRQPARSPASLIIRGLALRRHQAARLEQGLRPRARPGLPCSA